MLDDGPLCVCVGVTVLYVPPFPHVPTFSSVEIPLSPLNHGFHDHVPPFPPAPHFPSRSIYQSDKSQFPFTLSTKILFWLDTVNLRKRVMRGLEFV